MVLSTYLKNCDKQKNMPIILVKCKEKKQSDSHFLKPVWNISRNYLCKTQLIVGSPSFWSKNKICSLGPFLQTTEWWGIE